MIRRQCERADEAGGLVVNGSSFYGQARSFDGDIENLVPLADSHADDLHSQLEKMFVELSEQQKSLRCLIDNLPAGVILVDWEFRILGGNRTYFRYFDDKAALPLGKRLDAALPLAEESGLMKLLRYARETGKSMRVRNFRYDGFAKGPTYWSGSIIHLTIPSESGPVKALAVLALDVTEEVGARERLTELAALAERRAVEVEVERSRLRTVLEAVPVPLFVYDMNMNVVIHNSAAKHLCENIGLEQWLNNGLGNTKYGFINIIDSNGNLIDPNDYPIARSIRGEVCNDEVVRWQSADMGVRSFLINSTPLRDVNGDITGAVAAATDITEQEQARERIQEIYRREHYIADKLQRSFIPYELPDINGFEVAQHYRPALDEELVGGDFYDVFPLGEERYGVVIADVSGKGLKAAVYTAMTKYMLRAYAMRDGDPTRVLARLNEALTSCTPPEVFVTLVYAVIDERRRTFVYANAGHEQPICYSRDAGFATALDVTGPALGLISGARYLEHKVSLSAGDIVLMYTDGVTDAGYGSDRLGHEAVLTIIEDRAGEPAQEICDFILDRAVHLADGKLGDDAAMLLIRTMD